MSSMQSAPTTIPPISEATFSPALAPLSVATVRCLSQDRAARRPRPARAPGPAHQPRPDSDRRTSQTSREEYERVASARCPACRGRIVASRTPILPPHKGILTSRRAHPTDPAGGSGFSGARTLGLAGGHAGPAARINRSTVHRGTGGGTTTGSANANGLVFSRSSGHRGSLDPRISLSGKLLPHLPRPVPAVIAGVYVPDPYPGGYSLTDRADRRRGPCRS